MKKAQANLKKYRGRDTKRDTPTQTQPKMRHTERIKKKCALCIPKPFNSDAHETIHELHVELLIMVALGIHLNGKHGIHFKREMKK